MFRQKILIRAHIYCGAYTFIFFLLKILKLKRKIMSNQDGSNLNFKNIQTFQTCLNEKVIKRLKKSIVFADNQFMEWFSLTIGIDYLIKSGVLNIKEFSSFQVIIMITMI